jgi:CRP-like cAMP-binding protein
MARTLRTVYDEANRRFAARDFVGALKIYRMLLETAHAGAGADVDIRLRIGDTLLALGEETGARRVYASVATHSIRAGLPLYGVVAIKILEQLKVDVAPAVEALAETYGEGSERVGKGARPAPLDLDLEVRDDVQLDFPIAAPALIEQCVVAAGAQDAAAKFPDKVPPIPLFSLLAPETFMDVIRLVQLRRTADGTFIIREGEIGESFFVIARGTVRVTQHDVLGKERELATLGDGSVFGEMALISNSPRTATVTAAGPIDLLEFNRETLTAASEQLIDIATALDRFTRDRLVQNILATNPLFRPFDRAQRLELLRRFSAHEVTPGTVIVREGMEGKGLYLILTGEVDVTKVDGKEKVLLATLRAGECFGEISLVKRSPTTATVTSARHTTVLFLPRDAFLKLVDALPELATYFRELTEERLMDTRLVLDRSDEEDEQSLADVRHIF